MTSYLHCVAVSLVLFCLFACIAYRGALMVRPDDKIMNEMQFADAGHAEKIMKNHGLFILLLGNGLVSRLSSVRSSKVS